MKKSEVKIGEVYRAKVSGKFTSVIINDITTNYFGKTRYIATNLKTSRQIYLRSAARLTPTMIKTVK